MYYFLYKACFQISLGSRRSLNRLENDVSQTHWSANNNQIDQFYVTNAARKDQVHGTSRSYNNNNKNNSDIIAGFLIPYFLVKHPEQRSKRLHLNSTLLRLILVNAQIFILTILLVPCLGPVKGQTFHSFASGVVDPLNHGALFFPALPEEPSYETSDSYSFLLVTLDLEVFVTDVHFILKFN